MVKEMQLQNFILDFFLMGCWGAQLKKKNQIVFCILE
jgi:hypothetical protein